MNDIIKNIRQNLLTKLSEHRYEHSIAVSYTCISLSMKYQYDLKKAELAGLLHDCAKFYDNHTLIKLCQKADILLTSNEIEAPSVLHSIYGAWLAKKEYQITDSDIIDGIRWHTTGKPNMSLLEKIVFVSDYIEPGRNKAANLSAIRKIAYEDLDQCVCQILEDTLLYLEQKQIFIHPETINAFKYYKSQQ